MVCFRATDGAFCLMDMGSAHGTFVSGRPCKRVRGVAMHCQVGVPALFLCSRIEDASLPSAGPDRRAEGRC